jgi:HJR/Mrr/RecB family endonuclease
MARKRGSDGSKNPFRSYWLPALCLLVTALISWRFWWVWIPVVVTLIVIVVIQSRRQKFVAMTMAEIDALDGPQFERYLVGFFRARGCEIVHSGRSGDFGADLLVVDKGVKYAVQAKNYDTGKVSNKAVQEAFTAASYYKCERAMVVTNARFTAAAREQAQRCNPPVVLVGRDELGHLLKRMA